MVRSLWTGAAGMIAQQTAVDTIANNIANINTTGYKSSQNEFKSLLYQQLQTKTTSANGEQKPIDSQVGLGVRSSSITTIFTQGSFYESNGNADFAIDGSGFFGVKDASGEVYYTRNGSFNFSENGQGGLVLCNSQGSSVLDSKGEPIVLDESVPVSNLNLSGDGELFYMDENGNAVSLDIRIGTWQFNNPAGLEKLSDSLYRVTGASGEALNEETTANIEKSKIVKGYLEGSNVQLADEMVNLIVAQRAYEANSKAITTSDTMMEQANQLKR